LTGTGVAAFRVPAAVVVGAVNGVRSIAVALPLAAAIRTAGGTATTRTVETFDSTLTYHQHLRPPPKAQTPKPQQQQQQQKEQQRLIPSNGRRQQQQRQQQRRRLLLLRRHVCELGQQAPATSPQPQPPSPALRRAPAPGRKRSGGVCRNSISRLSALAMPEPPWRRDSDTDTLVLYYEERLEATKLGDSCS
jgi:hypothetical protein